jgi:uridine kinase
MTAPHTQDRHITVAELATATTARLLDDLDRQVRPLALITGPSCAGKTTLTTAIIDILIPHTTTTILAVDDHLHPEHRGQHSYAADEGIVLTPAHYDWSALWDHLSALEAGRSVTAAHYERGTGWTSLTSLPARVHIIEGLFLDSTAAALDRAAARIGLCAPQPVLHQRRLARDDEIRLSHPTWRDPTESAREAERTWTAFTTYDRSAALPWAWHVLTHSVRPVGGHR